MNFVFFIIMFCVLELSVSQNHDSLDTTDLSKNMGLKVKDIAISTPNLKLNVFDKMLSEEMLSIKQYFQEKDSSHTPTVRITVLGIGATPTLEVKQKWPIRNLFLKSWNTNNRGYEFINDEVEQKASNLSSNGTSTSDITDDHCSKNGCNSKVKDKIVGLRSLPETREMKICVCMKTNAEPTCSHRCTGIDASKVTKTCRHTSTDLKHECTRTAGTVSTYLTYPIYPIYVTHPSYFWGLSTFTENPYYHPNPINEIKISKTKKRHKIKKPRPIVEERYQDVFQDNNEQYHDNSMENYIESIEVYDEDTNNLAQSKSTILKNEATTQCDDNTFKDKSIDNIDYVNKDSFANDVVEDLKDLYSDIVIKDCYCSLSSRSYILNNLVFFILSFLYVYLH